MSVVSDLNEMSDPKRARSSAWFFKTGPGQYGQGDKFIGVPVPDQRRIARKYKDLRLSEIDTLLKSPIHEHRLTALFILVQSYKKSEHRVYEFYLRHTKYINNWDLVDSSASYIVGEWLMGKDRDVLYKFARSKNLWERRIAIIASGAFIKNNDFKDTLAIAEVLLHDTHDLIHKAVGWMLREIGKRDQAVEEQFLKQHSKTMPRTMLRYAIEKFDERKRREYLAKTP